MMKPTVLQSRGRRQSIHHEAAIENPSSRPPSLRVTGRGAVVGSAVFVPKWCRSGELCYDLSGNSEVSAVSFLIETP